MAYEKIRNERRVERKAWLLAAERKVRAEKRAAWREKNKDRIEANK